MTTIFAAFNAGVAKWWQDALRCAVAFSKTKVIAVSDHDVGIGEWHDITPYLNQTQWYVKQSRPYQFGRAWRLDIACQQRWIVVDRFIQENRIEYPVFAPDWDVLIMHPLMDSFHYFKDCDFTCGGAAYHLNNDKVLPAYLKVVKDRLESRPQVSNSETVICDMHLWPKVPLKRCALDVPFGTDLFDINVHLDQGCVVDPDIEYSGLNAKKLHWRDHKPYCTKADTGQELKLHWIHCWGAYKQKTGEICRQANA